MVMCAQCSQTAYVAVLGALTPGVGGSQSKGSNSGVSFLKGMVLSRMSRRLSAVLEGVLGFLLTGETTLSSLWDLSPEWEPAHKHIFPDPSLLPVPSPLLCFLKPPSRYALYPVLGCGGGGG